MTVLALDIGINCGWARANGMNGTERFAYPDHGRALSEFSDWVERMLDTEPLVYLAVERGFGGNNAVGRLTTAMELTAHARAYDRNVPRTDRSASEVRKWLLGFGRLPKSDDSKAQRTRDMDKLILAAVRARGFMPQTEHSADACALLCMVEGVRPRELIA